MSYSWLEVGWGFLWDGMHLGVGCKGEGREQETTWGKAGGTEKGCMVLERGVLETDRVCVLYIRF